MPNKPVFEAFERHAASRAAVLDAYDKNRGLAAELGATLTLFGFVRAYNKGELKVPSGVRSIYPKLSYHTVGRWLEAREGKGDMGLVPNWHGRPSTIDRHPELKAFLEEQIAANPDARPKQLAEALKTVFGRRLQLSEVTIRRYLASR
jgi:hypothetical protein